MSAALLRHIWKWFSEPRNPMWNVCVMSAYTFMSVTGSTILRNATKNWRYDAGELTCVDHDPTFLYGATFEVIVSFVGFLLPVLFFKIDPGNLTLLLYLFEVIYIVQFLYPVRVIIRIFEIVQNWCWMTMRIFEVTLMAQSSKREKTIRNFTVLLIVAQLARIFAQYILINYYLKETASTYSMIIVCATLKAISIGCFIKYKAKPQKKLGEIYTLSLRWLKSEKIWFYIDFFIYLSGQNIFNEVIYQKILPSQKICFVNFNNRMCCLLNAIGSIIGSVIIILLSRRFKNIKLINIGLGLNLITYACIYLRLSTDSYSFDVFRKFPYQKILGINYSDVYLEIVFPFFLGISAAYSYIALLFLLASVYTQEISSSYAIYEIIKKFTEKGLVHVYRRYSLLSTLAVLSAFGMVGTLSVNAGYTGEAEKDSGEPNQASRSTAGPVKKEKKPQAIKQKTNETNEGRMREPLEKSKRNWNARDNPEYPEGRVKSLEKFRIPKRKNKDRHVDNKNKTTEPILHDRKRTRRKPDDVY